MKQPNKKRKNFVFRLNISDLLTKQSLIHQFMKEGELELSPSQLLFFRTDTLASKFLTEYLFILVLV